MTQGGGAMLTSKMPQRWCSPAVSFHITFTTAEAHLWEHLDIGEATLGKQSQHHSEHSPWSPRRLARSLSGLPEPFSGDTVGVRQCHCPL